MRYIFIIDKDYKLAFIRVVMLTGEKAADVSRRPIRDGINAIPVVGETVVRRCSHDSCHSEFEVPIYILDNEQRAQKEYSEGLFLKGVYVIGRELSNGVYISRERDFFCRLPCWSYKCDD